ncbi:MAG TPA: alpha/beta hydrolase [Vicinamibacterales bacterium]|nr:alpha/beta hydrolase [Vicinamibacterales bacterium]
MHERSAGVPGALLSVRDSGGTGIPVVFVHAATGSTRVWEHQESAFVDAGFRFIAYDRRGFGSTTVDVGADPVTGADDLDALMAALRVDRFHLVGTAAGGIVCFDYAISFPSRLRSLVVANSIGGFQDPAFVERVRQLRPPPFEQMPAAFRELGPVYRAENPEGTRRWNELQRASWPDGVRPPPQPTRNRLTLELLGRFTAPTLLVAGDADLYAPPPLMNEFATRIANAESIVLSGVGHSAYWERPDLFNSAVLAFIRKH